MKKKPTGRKSNGGQNWSCDIRPDVVECLLVGERPHHLISLAIWFACSFGLGIILRPALEGIMVGGADLGFWFAQQGSIYVFLVLIFVYAWRMNKLDREYGVDE